MPTIEQAGFAMLQVVPFPSDASSERVRPLISADARPHYQGLEQGRLLVRCCLACARHRLPSAPVCPWCNSPRSAWVTSSGRGKLHSWVRYHRSFLEEFSGLVPYVVASVELNEGPLVIGRLVTNQASPVIGEQAQAVVEKWSDGFCSLAFSLPGGDA